MQKPPTHPSLGCGSGSGAYCMRLMRRPHTCRLYLYQRPGPPSCVWNRGGGGSSRCPDVTHKYKAAAASRVRRALLFNCMASAPRSQPLSSLLCQTKPSDVAAPEDTHFRAPSWAPTNSILPVISTVSGQASRNDASGNSATSRDLPPLFYS